MAVPQQLRRAREPEVPMIGDRCPAERVLEIAGEVELREAGDRGHLAERDVAVVMVVQEAARPLEPAVEFAAGRRLGGLQPVDRGPALGERLGERIFDRGDQLPGEQVPQRGIVGDPAAEMLERAAHRTRPR